MSGNNSKAVAVAKLREFAGRREVNQREYAWLMKQLGQAVVNARDAGVTPTEIITESGLSRRTVYLMLGEAAQ